MNTIELMDGSVSSFSKTDRAIYEAIRKFPDTFATSRVTQLSLPFEGTFRYGEASGTSGILPDLEKNRELLQSALSE